MSAPSSFLEEFRPMLGAKTPEGSNIKKLRYPLWASPKLDGIRAIVIDGIVYSRTLKPIRNSYVQQMFGIPELDGFDGELILGSPTAPNVYNNTNSAVMTIGCDTPVTFHAFDHVYQDTDNSYASRLEYIQWTWDNLTSKGRDATRDAMTVLEQKPLNNWDEVLAYEQKMLRAGYEGVMLRDPNAEYKYGRSTLIEGALVKLKRFKDAEATVLDFEELMTNNNEPVLNALGYTKRSTAMAGLTPAGTLGALICHNSDGVVFNVGSGFDMATRDMIWAAKEQYVGKIVKYKYFEYGELNKPRHPIFLGFRDPMDF